ncbi:NADP-dependent oxidoreductase domain containing protein [Naviculisporaceae sp. PSN 640]
MSTKTGNTAKEMLLRTIQVAPQRPPNPPNPTRPLHDVPPRNHPLRALASGYRGFDSAQWYYNESETASAIASFLQLQKNAGSDIKRQDIFFTTKLQKNSASAESVRTSINKSLDAVVPQLGYIDLFLLHSPLGGKEARLNSWKTLEEFVLSEEGKIKSIGVSNYGVKHIEELMATNPRVKPAVNQIEVHPFNTQREIRKCCEKYGIVVEAYAPLARGERFGKSKVLKELAGRYGVSEAQIMVRWSIQHGFVTLPKSARKERLVSNADVGGFEISKEDMNALDGLDEHLVTDWDPTDAA